MKSTLFKPFLAALLVIVEASAAPLTAVEKLLEAITAPPCPTGSEWSTLLEDDMTGNHSHFICKKLEQGLTWTKDGLEMRIDSANVRRG